MPFLDFKGKSVIYSHHLGVPFRTLKVDAKKSLPGLVAVQQGKSNGERNSTSARKASLDDNLIIHGDNLHALKALLPRYSGKIKCIYIDPPYNTGNEGWKYNDKVNSPIIKAWLKQNGIGTDDEERHDKWLCMMWPRLQLLKELLADDGVIFVSIDDNEQFRLMAIMEEIFGEENYISTIIKKTKIGGGSDTTHIVREHDYIIVYAKNKKKFPEMFIKHDKIYLNRYKEEDKKGKFFWDTFSRPGLRQPLNYDIVAPDGTKINGDWIRSKERFKKDVHSGEIKFEKKKNGKWTVLFKQRLNEYGKKPRSLSKEIGGTIEGKNEIREIFNNDRVFSYPKSSQIIKYLLESINAPDAIILDSFAGSGTTAHAVLDLNKEDGGRRKFILVECEDYADKITAERVRRVIKGVPKAKDENLRKGLGGSFTYCSLGEEINIENMLRGKDLPDYNQLARYIFYTATGRNLDTLAKANPAWFVGETRNYRFHLVYKPDLDFLNGKESALHLDLAETIKKFNDKSKKISLVYAPASYITQKKLKKKYGIQFCQLPFHIHKIMGV